MAISLFGGWNAALSATRSQATDPVFAETCEGRLAGYGTGTLNVFKGVRYGESTAGRFRYRAPRPVLPWAGIRRADAFASPAAQDSQDLPAWQDPGLPGSEDCLFLNIWAPKASGKLPVMVFIHGGAFMTGSGGVPLYDCAPLAEATGTLVINLNHRLNVFGNLYLSGMSDAFDANVGQLDIIEALRWIRRNVSAFGGDPDNVTLFGESGGGMKISALLGMPAAKGLFHKAIVQSGSLVRARTPQAGTLEAEAVLAKLGLSHRDVDRIAQIPTQRLIEAGSQVAATAGYEVGSLPFAPVLDPASLPYQLDSERSLALWADVPLLVGSNEAEAALLYYPAPSMPELGNRRSVLAELRRIAPWLQHDTSTRLLDLVRAQAPKSSGQEHLISAATLGWLWPNAVLQAEHKLDQARAPVFMYQFGWRDPVLGGRWATHATDLVFLFDKFAMNGIWDDTDLSAVRARFDPQGKRFALRDAMMAAWAAFARNGEPSNPLLPSWPRYDACRRATMRLDAECTVVSDPFGSDIRKLLTRPA